MTRQISLRVPSVLLVALLGLGSPLLACNRDQKLGDKAKDALDLREHEKLKDAAEDARDAAKDAGAAVKEEAESMKKKEK